MSHPRILYHPLVELHRRRNYSQTLYQTTNDNSPDYIYRTFIMTYIYMLVLNVLVICIYIYTYIHTYIHSVYAVMNALMNRSTTYCTSTSASCGRQTYL